MVNTTNYAIPNQHPTSTQDQRHQLDDSLLGLRSTAMLDTATVVSVALFVRCAQAELTSSGLLMLDSTQYVRAITNNEQVLHQKSLALSHLRLPNAVHRNGISDGVCAPSERWYRRRWNSDERVPFVCSNQYCCFKFQAPAATVAFFSCELTRGGHPYVVDQTTTVDGLLPISTMQSR